eukprot:XP_001610388.1 hypothetical protein [Babesia bovis T2Bo]
MEQLKSIAIQVESPGEYVATRLESVALDDIKRELTGLLASCQSNASGMLMSLFASAKPYNETIESTIEAIKPLRRLLKESLTNLDIQRETLKQTKWEAKRRMFRYVMVAYAKMALITHVDAIRHLDNIAEEILDTFMVQYDDVAKMQGTVVQKAVVLARAISKRMESVEYVLRAHDKYNIATNWAVFEIVPRELKRIQGLLKSSRHYEMELSKYMEHYLKLLQEVDPNEYKRCSGLCTDRQCSDVERLLSFEKLIEWNELDRFRDEFNRERAERSIVEFHQSLYQLVSTCAKTTMHILFTFYKEREKINANETSDIIAKEKITSDITTYVTGLSSLLKGAEHLQQVDAKVNNPIKVPFVGMYRDIFVKPIMNICLSKLVQKEGGVTMKTPQEEAVKFRTFVDVAIEQLLHPKQSIPMQLLIDVTKVTENDSFKVCCVFDAIAAELLYQFEKRFSAVYFPIYLDRFIGNVEAYERLLGHIEIAAGGYRHYLKWRGSKIPNGISRCFSIGVVCDNYIEDTTQVLSHEIAISNGPNGNLHEDGWYAFYMTPSMVLYRQMMALWSHSNFFYHLLHKYLVGTAEMIQEYIRYVQKQVSAIEAEPVTEPTEITKAAESTKNAGCILNDLSALQAAVQTGSVNMISLELLYGPLESQEDAYQEYLTQNRYTNGYLSSDQSMSSDSTDKTNPGNNQSKTSINGSNPESDASAVEVCQNGTCNIGITLKSNLDGNVVKAAVRKLEYPLQVAFKRLVYALRSLDDGITSIEQNSIDILASIWKTPSEFEDSDQFIMSNANDLAHDYFDKLTKEDRMDIVKLVSFTKRALQLMYNFFNSAHEQIDGVKYTLENYIIRNLVSNAKCSLQFLQSLPSKFRASSKPDVSIPSNYVKYMLIPLLSFKEFESTTIPQEVTRKIMTHTISHLTTDYKQQVVKLIRNVDNLNRSLGVDKNMKEQEAANLIVDMTLIKSQLITDIEEFVNQCDIRLDVHRNHCEDLQMLLRCVNDLTCDNKQ